MFPGLPERRTTAVLPMLVLGLASQCVAIATASELAGDGSAGRGVVVQTTTPGGLRTTSLPAGSVVVGGIDTSSGTPRLVTRTSNPQSERVLIQLRGASSTQARALGLNASREARGLQRQRVADAILRLAAQGGQARAPARSDLIRREYEQVFHGFAARLPSGVVSEVRRLPDVVAVHPDAEVHARWPTVCRSSGLRRSGRPRAIAAQAR